MSGVGARVFSEVIGLFFGLGPSSVLLLLLCFVCAPPSISNNREFFLGKLGSMIKVGGVFLLYPLGGVTVPYFLALLSDHVWEVVRLFCCFKVVLVFIFPLFYAYSLDWVWSVLVSLWDIPFTCALLTALCGCAGIICVLYVELMKSSSSYILHISKHSHTTNQSR